MHCTKHVVYQHECAACRRARQEHTVATGLSFHPEDQTTMPIVLNSVGYIEPDGGIWQVDSRPESAGSEQVAATAVDSSSSLPTAGFDDQTNSGGDFSGAGAGGDFNQ